MKKTVKGCKVVDQKRVPTVLADMLLTAVADVTIVTIVTTVTTNSTVCTAASTVTIIAVTFQLLLWTFLVKVTLSQRFYNKPTDRQLCRLLEVLRSAKKVELEKKKKNPKTT